MKHPIKPPNAWDPKRRTSNCRRSNAPSVPSPGALWAICRGHRREAARPVWRIRRINRLMKTKKGNHKKKIEICCFKFVTTAFFSKMCMFDMFALRGRQIANHVYFCHILQTLFKIQMCRFPVDCLFGEGTINL